MKQWFRIYGMVLVVLWAGTYEGRAEERNTEAPLRVSSLEECVNIALEQHVGRQVSKTAIQIAETQHQQALSAYWPQIEAGALLARRDEDLDFSFPQETEIYRIKGLTQVPLDVEVTIPEKRVKLVDRDMLYGSVDMTYPLFTGGKRGAAVEQSETGVQLAREDARRTELQMIFDVTRMYWGAILARNLCKLGQQTVERFEATLKVTERFYQAGSGSVQKTDYLRMQAINSGLEAMLETLKSNETLARAALVNSIGLPWNSVLQLDETELPLPGPEQKLPSLVTDAYRFNPDWIQLELALQIAESHVQEAKGERSPIIALQGRLDATANSHDTGLMTEANRESWMLGLAMKVPVFTGFRNRAQLEEARLRVEKLQHQQLLFREGLALQVQHAFLQLERSRRGVEALSVSLEAAEEYRHLTIRAYQHELAETREVIEAQVFEAFLRGQYLKVLYDHAVSQAQLEFLIGHELQKHFQ